MQSAKNSRNDSKLKMLQFHEVQYALLCMTGLVSDDVTFPTSGHNDVVCRLRNAQNYQTNVHQEKSRLLICNFNYRTSLYQKSTF